MTAIHDGFHIVCYVACVCFQNLVHISSSLSGCAVTLLYRITSLIIHQKWRELSYFLKREVGKAVVVTRQTLSASTTNRMEMCCKGNYTKTHLGYIYIQTVSDSFTEIYWAMFNSFNGSISFEVIWIRIFFSFIFGRKCIIFLSSFRTLAW